MKQLFKTIIKALPTPVRLQIDTAQLLFRQRALFDLSNAKYRSQERNSFVEKCVSSLATDGFIVLPDYKSREWCSEARKELLDVMSSGMSKTSTDEDDRVFGAEKVCAKASEFAHDEFLLEVAKAHARSEERLMFCMANRVSYKGGVTWGSGGDWHRDGFRREMKAMLYLTDVEIEDGPFSLIRGSHLASSIFHDVSLVKHVGDASGVSGARLGKLGDVIAQKSPDRGVKFLAPQGTVILFDTSTIHSGQPPRKGGKDRLALTNYYVDSASFESALDYYRPRVKLN